MSRPRGNAVGRRALRFSGALVCTLAGTALATGCPDRNRGVSPQDAGLFFPAGTVLDPRVPEGTPARWMFVLNANSDLVFNSGTLVPVDLDRFFSAWMRDPRTCFASDGGACEGDPDCATGQTCVAKQCVTDGAERAEACRFGRPPGSPKTGAWASWPVVGDVGDELTAQQPCRHNKLKPQVVECEDTFFVEEEGQVFLGNFGTALRAWVPDPKEPQRDAKLLVAVRGDPSITLIDIAGDVKDVPQLDCGQGVDSTRYDPRRCDGAHLLRYVRNDPDGTSLNAEPANILATSGDPQILVTHSTSAQVTLIDLEGQYSQSGRSKSCKGAGKNRVCKDQVPAIIHTPTIFDLDGQLGGGWGLARRPCFPGTDNVPALSVTRGLDGEPVECGRSLIYAGFRTNLLTARAFITEGQPLDADALLLLLEDLNARVAALTIKIGATVDEDEKAALLGEKADLEATAVRYTAWLGPDGLDDTSFNQRCLTIDEVSDGELTDDALDKPVTKGAFICDARLLPAGIFRTAAFDLGLSGSANVLGDIAFSADGNRMFAVQTTPGALIYVDTSLDSRGLTRDASAGLIELCAQPTAMTLFSDGANEYAAVTCYKPQELFIVDLSGVNVVANMVLGTGPHSMTVDHARQYIYVANSLDKTLSVVDISRLRPTRFSEVARIGRQVPYLR